MRIKALSPLRRFRQVPSYSPHRLVRQSAMLQERPVQGCRWPHMYKAVEGPILCKAHFHCKILGKYLHCIVRQCALSKVIINTHIKFKISVWKRRNRMTRNHFNMFWLIGVSLPKSEENVYIMCCAYVSSTLFDLIIQVEERQNTQLVRFLRKTVMVRVGGGWVTLDEFLERNCSCRGTC